MNMDANVLPSELVATPQPLIGFSGLDITNPVHKTIWDAFCNNRKQDRVAIQFKLLPPNYDFTVLKPKRQSYEWYHPRGIIKRNWMLKHLHVLPSVVALFQEIEWNDPNWSQKQLQCASLVQSLKNSLQGRNTRIVVVLLQKEPTPADDDLLLPERAANLTNKCDISAKMLMVLQYNDHLMGYTMRLESAFLELAQSYYAQMARQVRLHRDQLTDSHQNLKIRHLFKLGFISEMRMDFSNALKHYSLAYSALDDIRILDNNCLEIKVISGFLNYKICKLLFKSNLPKDSITQFKNHIEKFRHRIGMKELRFEHFSWLSVQYNAFAELFSEAIKVGLTASQTQHPGVYYQKSAEYIGKRKEAFLECCALSMSPTEPLSPSVSGILYSDFFGVRGAKNNEPAVEQQIISLVQENEKTFNHSTAIITLMGQAMAQYKVNKCLRFRKKLAIDMADEYLKSGDHSKALTLFSLMLSDYRVDKWYTIFTEVLLKTLRSAYLSASVADFVSCSIEAMSPKINLSLNDRVNILENVWKVFQNVPPVSQSQITPELKLSWENALIGFKTPIIIDLDKISSLFDSKLTFEKSQIRYDENVQLELYLQSNTAVPFKLKNFAVVLTDSKSNYRFLGKSYNTMNRNEMLHEEQSLENVDFMLEPGKCYRITFCGEKYQFMENVELQVVRLEIQMGTQEQYIILTQSSTLNHTSTFKYHNTTSDYMNHIKINSYCYIIPTFHLSTHVNQTSQPMLVNEFFEVVTNVNNAFDVCLENVGISITVPNNLRNKVFLATDLTAKTQKLNSHIQIDIGNLQGQTTQNIVYYITSIVDGNIELIQKVWYQTANLHIVRSSPQHLSPMQSFDSPPPIKLNPDAKSRRKLLGNHNIKIDYTEDNIKKSKDDTVIISCIEEIKISAKYYTLSRQALMRAYKNEDFLLRINAEVKSDIDIIDTYFIKDYNIIEKMYSGQRKCVGNGFRNGDKIEEIRLLCPIFMTSEWLTQDKYNNSKVNLIFKSHEHNKNKHSAEKVMGSSSTIAASISTGGGNEQHNSEDNPFNKNLLSKLPTNSTIIGSSSLSNSQMFSLSISAPNEQQQLGGKPLVEEFNMSSSTNSLTMSTSMTALNSTIDNKSGSPRSVYNHAIDAINLIEENRGFFKKPPSEDALPFFGVYCMRWRRTGSSTENESKFVINGVEVIEPAMNVYCYFERKMYVRTPMTFRIVLKNPSSKILHLIASLNNSDSFMFAGHKQVNVSLFSHSEFVLSFNLYPLKLGWQQLPEFILEYNTQYDPEKKDETQQAELASLIKRWMPKHVFIHPPSKTKHL